MTTPRDASYISVMPPDGGWGWVVSVGAAWCNGAIFGMINSFSIMLVQIQQEYPLSDNYSMSWINSVFFGLTFALSPLAGILSDKFGIRRVCMTGSVIAACGMFMSSYTNTISQLLFTYGVVLETFKENSLKRMCNLNLMRKGIGASLTFSPSLVIIGHYFDKRLGLVNGLVTFFGSSLFTVCLPHILDYLFQIMTLKQVFRVLTLLYVIMFLFSMTFSTIQRPMHNRHGGSANFINPKLLRRGYIVWVISISVGLSGYTVIYIFIAPHVIQATGSDYGSVMVSAIGGSAAVGRLIFGQISDHPAINRVTLQQMSLFIFGLVFFALPHLQKIGYIFADCILFGLADGCFVTMMGPVAYDIVGNKGASQGLGFAFFVMSICMVFGSPLAGKIYDTTNSLDIAFYLAGGAAMLGAAILCAIPKKNTIGRKKTDSEHEMDRDACIRERMVGSKLKCYREDSVLDLNAKPVHFADSVVNIDLNGDVNDSGIMTANSAMYLSADVLYDQIRSPPIIREDGHDTYTEMVEENQTNEVYANTIITKLSTGKETSL